jgi:hypothetical protein
MGSAGTGEKYGSTCAPREPGEKHGPPRPPRKLGEKRQRPLERLPECTDVEIPKSSPSLQLKNILANMSKWCWALRVRFLTSWDKMIHICVELQCVNSLAGAELHGDQRGARFEKPAWPPGRGNR